MAVKMGLSRRIILQNLLIVLSISLVIVWIMVTFKDSLYRAKNDKIQSVVETAYGVVMHNVDEYKAGKMTLEQAQYAGMEALRYMKYDGNYIWINDMDYAFVMHPNVSRADKPAWYEKSGLVNYADPTGKRIFHEFIEICRKNGEGFVDYLWPKSGKENEKAVPKTSYVKLVREWNWVIGSGIFLDDAQAEIGRTMGILIAVVFLVLLAAILASVFMSNSIAASISKVTEMLSGGAQQVTSAAAQIASSGQELAQGASEQASALEETSSSLDEMALMIKHNTENAKQANDMAGDASRIAAGGMESMNRMSDSIKQIQASSSATAKIIKTIDEIAFQTNLLALNAAVEAARAGEAGRGFAVVAEEVRSLAKRSAEASKNTGELILNSQRNVENGVVVTQDVIKLLNEIASKAAKVSVLINEVTKSTEEQSRGIEQIAAASGEMDKVTQKNSANAEESASASEELEAQAENLAGVVEQLKDIIGKS